MNFNCILRLCLSLGAFLSIYSAESLANATCYMDRGASYAENDLNELSRDYVLRINQIVGVPAQPGKEATREDVEKNYSAYVVIDIGGEGYHESFGLKAGCKNAINLNVLSSNSQNQRPIDNLVKLRNWLDKYPIGSRFADYIMIQSAPLTSHNVDEIVRMLKPGGAVALWVDRKSFKSQIEDLAKKLNSSPAYDVPDEFSYEESMRKVFIRDFRNYYKIMRDDM